MTMQVIETEDGFDFMWDPTDPVESVFNDWTEDDFMRMLMNAAEKVIAEQEFAQKRSGRNSFEKEFMEK